VVGVVAVVAELLVWVDEVLDEVELVDCVVDGFEVELLVVAAEVEEEVVEGVVLVGLVVELGVDDVVGGVVAGPVEAPPGGVSVMGGVIVKGLDMI
jgi:hypothetical protein